MKETTAQDFQAGILGEVENVDFFKKYEKYILSTSRPRKPQTPRIVAYNKMQVGTVGNITGISAEYKAGKTAIVNYLLSYCLTGDYENFDGCENLTVTPNELNHALLLFDTEQDDSDQYYNFQNAILKRAGLRDEPAHLITSNIRELSLPEKREYTQGMFEAAYKRHGGIHLAIIDGIADYVSSVNDDKESAEILQFFAVLAKKYETCIVVIIHVNPGSQKERGHLGSELQRKCKSLLTIKKERDVSILEGKNFRSAKRGEFAPIQYEYDEIKGYHVFLGEAAKKPTQKELELYTLAQHVFTQPRTYTEATGLIMRYESCQIATAKNRVKAMTTAGYIQRDLTGDDVIYTLKQANNDKTPF